MYVQLFGIALTLSVRALTVLSHGILAGNLTVTAVLLLGVIGTSQYLSLSTCLSVCLSVRPSVRPSVRLPVCLSVPVILLLLLLTNLLTANFSSVSASLTVRTLLESDVIVNSASVMN